MRGVPERDPIEAVRRGYDALSHRYRGDDDTPAEYAPWLAALRDRLPAGARVLDLGCGCGIPVARALVDDGHEVTGVDLSDVQIERARRLVPRATFRRDWITRAGLRIESEAFVPEGDAGHQLFWAQRPRGVA